MLQDVSRLLAKVRAPGSFATRRTSAADDLRLDVKGMGCIGLPIARSTARRLCGVARPARYGFKDQTRLDHRIRDTWEIAKSRISIDQPRWRETLLPQLDRIRRDLGLPDDCRLRAEPHNLLVYEPGQFFVTHQDSEKNDDMIGTLVVILPSDFTGGAMVLEHHDEKVIFRGSGRKLTFIAFYADCHHEVRPIKQGYRVVLTYNLILEGDATAAAVRPTGQIEALARCAGDFFQTPPAPRWRNEPQREPPDRLVYLLDHQYTRRGLAWSRLKNGRCRARRGAARSCPAVGLRDVIRAKASARWAIGEVAMVLKAGDDEGARQMATRLLPFWAQVAQREEGRDFVEQTLRIAAGLDSPDLAASLLQPFTLERVTPKAAPRLVVLLDRYGLEWGQALLGRWASGDRHEGGERRTAWLVSVPGLCSAALRRRLATCARARAVARGRTMGVAREAVAAALGARGSEAHARRANQDEPANPRSAREQPDLEES